MTLNTKLLIGRIGLIVFILGVVTFAVHKLSDPVDVQRKNCEHRRGRWDNTWSVCHEPSRMDQCAWFCEGHGLVFKSYKDGNAAFQDERCECSPKGTP